MARKIALGLGEPPFGPHILEIGPGPGILTREILTLPGLETLTVVEKDEELADCLQANLENDPRLRVLSEDILELGWPEGFKGDVLANLPYYLTGRFFRLLFHHAENWNRVVVLVQKEIADRLSASLPGKQRGKMTVLFEAIAVSRVLFKVKPGAFHPPPKVTSAVIRLERVPLQDLPPAPVLAQLETIVEAAFSQKRKKAMPRILELPILDEGEELFLNAFTHLKDLRAEEISTQDFLKMARFLSKPL